MGIKISKDHLHPSVIESITSLIGDLSMLETDAKGNAVEAINELLAGGGSKEEIEALITEMAEGKELIANAIGEPLVAEDTFEGMSNDINGLLNQFKTNIMNNGVTVEANDKFKALIDKIATMVEEGSNKGVHYYRGNAPDINVGLSNRTGSIVIKMDLDFTPTFIWLAPSYNTLIQSERHYSRETATNVDAYFWITDITNTSFTLNYEYTSNSLTYTVAEYIAIGVGEEDTALRDSLASILEEEGVEVTEEDDMASLITKVDEEFDKQLIPAVCTNGTTLPLYSYIFDITHNGNTPTDYEIGYTFFNGYVSIGYYWYTPNNTYGLTHLTFISKDKDGNVIHTSETFDDNTGFPSYYENIKVVYGGKLFARVDTYDEYIYMELKDIVLYCNNIDF